jgi:exocyst complex component 6
LQITILSLHLKAQSDLILPNPLPITALPSLTQEISGFFIIETHVLNTTGDFRSEMEVEELWDALVGRLCVAVESTLRTETDPDVFLKVKECLIGFIMTLEVRSLSAYTFRHLMPYQSSTYATNPLHSFILLLFEKYAMLLEQQFKQRFEKVSIGHVLISFLLELITINEDRPSRRSLADARR